MMEITRAAGSIGIPGLSVTEDPGASEKAAKTGNLSLRLGLDGAKAQSWCCVGGGRLGRTKLMPEVESGMTAFERFVYSAASA